MAKKSKDETSTVVTPDAVNMLTPEVLDRLNLDETQRTALMEYASQFLKTGEQTPPRPEFRLYNIEPGTLVTLADLIGLDDTPIPDAATAMRKINKDNVTALEFAYESGSNVPPIEVVGSTWGVIILNGYHRREAMENLVKREFLTPDGKLAKDGKEQFERQLTKTVVEYSAFFGQGGEDPTVDDALNYATFANLKNGLQVSTENRSRLAIWYQARMRAQGIDLSARKLAPMFGVSHVAISRQLARDLAKTHPEMLRGKLPADVVIPATDREDFNVAIVELKDKEAARIDPLEQAVKSLIKAANFMYNNVDSGDDLARYMQGFISTGDDYYALQFVSSSVELLQEPENATEEATA